MDDVEKTHMGNEVGAIGPFNPEDGLRLEKVGNGGWIVHTTPAFTESMSKVIGAYSSAQEMLESLHTALTISQPLPEGWSQPCNVPDLSGSRRYDLLATGIRLKDEDTSMKVMVKWEYKCITIADDSLEVHLRMEGLAGWELVSGSRVEDKVSIYHVLYLKRPL